MKTPCVGVFVSFCLLGCDHSSELPSPVEIACNGNDDDNDGAIDELVLVDNTGLAYETLESAVAAAEPGSTVRLCAPIAGSVEITHDLTILGGGVDVVLTGHPGMRPLTVTGSDLRLIDIEVVGTDLTGSTGSRGGAILVSDGRLQMVGVLFSGGAAALGGAVYAERSEVYFDDQTLVTGGSAQRGGCLYAVDSTVVGEGILRGCSADQRGGGVFSDSSIVEGFSVLESTALYGGGVAAEASFLTGLVISDNHGDDGGGLSLLGVVDLRDLLISNNVATSSGGGMYLASDTTAHIHGSTLISGNSAVEGGGVGGYQSTLVMDDGSVVTSNVAELGGGGIFLSSAILGGEWRGNDARSGGGLFLEDSTVKAATIVGNVADVSGGGLYAVGVSLLEEVDVVDNVAMWGGGLDAWDGLSLVSTTVRENDATESGGGMYANPGTTVQGGRFVDNTAPEGGGLVLDGAHLSFAHIEGNRADLGGGALLVSSAILQDTTVAENVATLRGGGLFGRESVILASPVELRRIVIVDNTASLAGGGFSFEDQDVVLEDSTIRDNVIVDADSGAFGAGGTTAGFVGHPQLVVERCLFAHNVIHSSVDQSIDGAGGGLFVQDAVVVIEDSVFTLNEAGTNPPNSGFAENRGSGGALHVNATPAGSPEVTVKRTLFVGNRAPHGWGGAIRNQGGALTIEDSEIRSNFAGFADGPGYPCVRGSGALEGGRCTDGGAVYSADGLTVIRDTLVSEHALGAITLQSVPLGSRLEGVTIRENTGVGVAVTSGSVDIVDSTFVGQTFVDESAPALLLDVSGDGGTNQAVAYAVRGCTFERNRGPAIAHAGHWRTDWSLVVEDVYFGMGDDRNGADMHWATFGYDAIYHQAQDDWHGGGLADFSCSSDSPCPSP